MYLGPKQQILQGKFKLQKLMKSIVAGRIFQKGWKCRYNVRGYDVDGGPWVGVRQWHNSRDNRDANHGKQQRHGGNGKHIPVEDGEGGHSGEKGPRNEGNNAYNARGTEFIFDEKPIRDVTKLVGKN